MAREDYDEIKAKFEQFAAAIKYKSTEHIAEIFEPDVKCYFSTTKAYTDGSNHTVYGIDNFIKDMPQTDFFHTRICNYICRLNSTDAQQCAHIVCLTGRYGEKTPLYFMFNMMFSNHWKKGEKGWRISEMQMDVLPEEGNFTEFQEHWYFEDPHPKTMPGIHLPCINGELDSPWFRIPDSEDVLTEEEKIAQAFYRYAFGIDHLVFHEVEKAAADDVIADIQPWGAMDKRSWITSLKYHRQKDRQWGHCGMIHSITVQGDGAHMQIYRMCGHKQREHPYVYTNENVDIEHVCASYEIDLIKEENVWKIKRCNYYLGLIDLGNYERETEVII